MPSEQRSSPPPDLEASFDRLYGLEITAVADGVLRGRIAVRDELTGPAGIVHGGVYAAIAESLATGGTALAARDRGETASGLTNHTSTLRPVATGTIEAVARPQHRGRTTWVWEVELADDEGRLCALSRVTVAVRPGPAKP